MKEKAHTHSEKITGHTNLQWGSLILLAEVYRTNSSKLRKEGEGDSPRQREQRSRLQAEAGDSAGDEGQ